MKMILLVFGIAAILVIIWVALWFLGTRQDR
jgi:hypothetical protein